MSTEIVNRLKAPKLHGMASNWPELVARCRHSALDPEALVEQLLDAEGAERQVRSIGYQMKAARFPAHRDLAGFDFQGTPVDEALVRKLHTTEFTDAAHNVVFIGGPGTGKIHLATALGVEAVQRHGKRVRFQSTVELVNALETEKAQGKTGQLAHRLMYVATRIMQAQAAQQPFVETLAALLQDELDRRRTSQTERSYKRSGLDERPTLVDFDWQFNPKLPRSACFELHTLKFVAEGANALLVGKPGTGKSHTAKAVAYQATLQGLHVRYVEADTALAQYALASAQEQAALIQSWSEPDLLVLDDLFLARRIPEAAAELLQAVVHRRYKLRRSIAITSNRVVTDWGKYLKDVTMATTILDRLMHRCSMLEFEGKSYRLKEAANRLALNTEPS